ncbi:MAG: tRNA pseudouridine(38-40) synthase TruA [Clostridiales bacterium]|nr:tRNA pseudouridine(38-40) synthase TruA [Clostridiales bacterium]
MAKRNIGKNIVLTVAYDGTDFFGFQSQAGTGLPTIQEALEDAVFRLTGVKTVVEGSGRTDTGVHAWGQVVHFFTESTIPPERWAPAMLPHLPESIIIRHSCEKEADFHARFSAKEKTYVYQYYCSQSPSPFHRRYAYHVPYPLDTDAMKEAASLFEGSHDFRAFCASGAKVKSYEREIFACTLSEEPPLLKLSVKGNGFLWNMVRIIAGTLLEVGAGKKRPEDVPILIGMGDRRIAGATLPPHGLILESVGYGAERL